MREFEREGLRGGAPADEPFAGNERGDLWLAALVPSVPRALTVTPLEQFPKLLFGMSSQRTSKEGGP